MAERSKTNGFRTQSSSLGVGSNPTTDKVHLCNYDNYCLKCHAGPTHLSRVVVLLVSIVFCNYDNYYLQYYAGPTYPEAGYIK